MKKIVLSLLIIVPMVAMSFTSFKKKEGSLNVQGLKLESSLIASMEVNGLKSFSEKDNFDTTISVKYTKGTLHKSSFSTKDKDQKTDPKGPDPKGPGPTDLEPLKILVEKYI